VNLAHNKATLQAASTFDQARSCYFLQHLASTVHSTCSIRYHHAMLSSPTCHPAEEKTNTHIPYAAATTASRAAAAFCHQNTQELLCSRKCSQAASCPQAQHDANTRHVAQGTECQGVHSGEAYTQHSSNAAAAAAARRHQIGSSRTFWQPQKSSCDLLALDSCCSLRHGAACSGVDAACPALHTTACCCCCAAAVG
jgi:hypothetical protein